MSVAYNGVLRAVWAKVYIKPVDVPARTTGVTPWNLEAPVHPLAQFRPPVRQNVDQPRRQVAPSFEGVPGRGKLTPDAKEAAVSAWWGPVVGGA